MIQSYDYIQFINEKVMEYLPADRVRVGDKLNFRCPLCGDSHKSLTKKRGFYYLKNASFFCFNCSTGMTGLKLLQTLSGKDYAEIKTEYAKEFAKGGFSRKAFFPEEKADGFDLMHIKPALDPSWKLPLSEDAKAYLAGRMVDRAPFLREDFFSYKGRRGDYILIPWVVNGVDAYYQLNDYKKLGSLKYVFPKDSSKLVYGLDNVDLSWPYVIVFEGVYDSLFVKNAVAVGTKSLSERQEKLIRERYPNHRICLSFDNDKPGLDATAKAVERGGDYLFFRWFDDATRAKDVNEAVLAAGDPSMFSDAKSLEKSIFTPLQTKLWLIQRKGYSFSKDRPRRAEKARQGGPLITRRSLFE
jgi:hypothetical protein